MAERSIDGVADALVADALDVWDIPMAAKDYLQRFWLYLVTAGIVVILLAAGMYVVETLPPRRIVMATGAEGGAYHDLGIRYRELLAQAVSSCSC